MRGYKILDLAFISPFIPGPNKFKMQPDGSFQRKGSNNTRVSNEAAKRHVSVAVAGLLAVTAAYLVMYEHLK